MTDARLFFAELRCEPEFFDLSHDWNKSMKRARLAVTIYMIHITLHWHVWKKYTWYYVGIKMF